MIKYINFKPTININIILRNEKLKIIVLIPCQREMTEVSDNCFIFLKISIRVYKKIDPNLPCLSTSATQWVEFFPRKTRSKLQAPNFLPPVFFLLLSLLLLLTFSNCTQLFPTSHDWKRFSNTNSVPCNFAQGKSTLKWMWMKQQIVGKERRGVTESDPAGHGKEADI